MLTWFLIAIAAVVVLTIVRLVARLKRAATGRVRTANPVPRGVDMTTGALPEKVRAAAEAYEHEARSYCVDTECVERRLPRELRERIYSKHGLTLARPVMRLNACLEPAEFDGLAVALRTYMTRRGFAWKEGGYPLGQLEDALYMVAKEAAARIVDAFEKEGRKC